MSDGKFRLVKFLDAPVVINTNINPSGAYDNATAYKSGDLVSYLGASYIALGATTGNLPTDTNFWQLLVDPPVDSVNGLTGTVVLDPDDLDDTSTTNKFITASQLSEISTNTTKISADGSISTHSNVDLTGLANNDLLKYNSTSGNFETVAQTDVGVTDHSALNLDDGTNPHNTTKSDVGLGNVDNTSDLNKPISTATQNALDDKIEASDIADFETSTQLNSRDSANRDRANHTGTQTASTISNFDTEVSNNTDVLANTAKVSADGSIATHSNVSLTGLANNDLLKYNSTSGNFEPIAQSDVGVTDHSALNLDDGTNPHNTTKADVGLANVDNTSDANKPISSATQSALDDKLEASDISDFETTTELNARDTANRNRANHTGTQLASTISNFDTEVSNNTDVAANTAKVSADGSIGTHSDVDLTGLANDNLLQYNSTSGSFEPVAKSTVGVTDHSGLNLDDGTNPHNTPASDVGLGNVDNTSDLDKPISSATQSALDGKLESVVAGTNVTVDTTDPNNPIINSTATGGKFIDGSNPDDAVYLDGDVGIGTSSPSEKLEVIGNVKSDNIIVGDALSSTDRSRLNGINISRDQPRIIFENTKITDDFERAWNIQAFDSTFRLGTLHPTTSSAGKDFMIANRNGVNITSVEFPEGQVVVSESLYLSKTSGNLLTVGNGTYGTKYLQVRAGGNYALRWGLQANNNIENQGTGLMTSSKAIAFKSGIKGTNFNSVTDTTLMLTNSEKVGIGTNNPTAKLELVNVDEASASFKISTNGGDGDILTVDENENVGINEPDPESRLHVNGAITQNPLSADPPDPSAGNSVQWVSDGTGSGDAGDVMMKINVGGTVKTITLVDFSEV